MKKASIIALAALAAGTAAATLRYLAGSMDAAEAVRRLAGMRVAVTLYRMAKGSAPADFGAVISGGQLEAPPQLKLKWHRASSKVRQTNELRAKDTGAWAYVNNPKSADFGTVFIDCTHKDERGRYWSEF
jgi:hypothetical protein